MKTPGVYIQQQRFPFRSIGQVETAIPVFIGYTEKAVDDDGNSLLQKAWRINSFLEYQSFFGLGPKQHIQVILNQENLAENVQIHEDHTSQTSAKYHMYYAIQAFYDNGGGPCYIFSVNDGYPKTDQSGKDELYVHSTNSSAALNNLRQVDEITLLILPDLELLKADKYYTVVQAVLAHCGQLQDRFAILDLKTDGETITSGNTPVSYMRENTGTKYLKYGAVYHPHLRMNYTYRYDHSIISFIHQDDDKNSLELDGIPYIMLLSLLDKQERSLATPGDSSLQAEADSANSLLQFFTKHPVATSNSTNANYNLFRPLLNADFKAALDKTLRQLFVTLPASAAVAGAYALTDRSRGVWKAPANLVIENCFAPLEQLSEKDQADFNIHPSGKSVNIIRSFTGNGIRIWGARTLAGNDNEWRYVNVRRLFNMIEESLQKTLQSIVFEPNDANTWISLKSAINNFLNNLWRQGAMAGATPEDAYFVKIGLGETMTATDILEGKMIAHIGIAAAFPAEFIVIKIAQSMET